MKKLVAVLAILSAIVASTSADAMPIDPLQSNSSMMITVSGGCGPYAWRGPWGHCRNTPYYGPLPGGYYQPEPHPVFGCPPGYWLGPWGHCRNTPYHGRIPGGGWQ